MAWVPAVVMVVARARHTPAHSHWVVPGGGSLHRLALVASDDVPWVEEIDSYCVQKRRVQVVKILVVLHLDCQMVFVVVIVVVILLVLW